MKDFYSVLEISKDAGPEEIKKAYRKKALAYHPDRNQGDPKAEAKFKEVSEAYEVLSDENKRRVYDQYGEDGLKGFGGGGHPGGAPHGFGSMEEALRTFMGAFGGSMGGGGGGGESIFESFFGGGFDNGAGAARKGASKKTTIRISFEEAMAGCEKEIALINHVECETCSGSGARSHNGIQTCPTCHGKGQVFQSRGFFSMSSSCPSCHGEGQVITDPCRECQGAGRVKAKRKVKVRIPAGVDSGMRLKMTGYGDAGDAGGPAGDLFVYIEVEASEDFQREGDDIYIDLPLTFAEAALGCKKEIPTPLSEVCKLAIPEGTQSGKILRVKGKGFPNVHGQGTGDLLARIIVETPVKLTDKQKELLRAFEKTETPQNHPTRKSFLERVKVFFSK
jgi:molecular chaperone DnaJ